MKALYFIIVYLDTGLILKEALKKELITESTGNRMWTSMKLRKRKLPYQTFTEFLKIKSQMGPSYS